MSGLWNTVIGVTAILISAVVLPAVAQVQPASFVGPPAPPPPIDLDELEPACRPELIRAAKNIYTLPNGTIVDLNVLSDYQRAVSDSIVITKTKLPDKPGSVKILRDVSLTNSDPILAYQSSSTPPLGTSWTRATNGFMEVPGCSPFLFVNEDPYLRAASALARGESTFAGVRSAKTDAQHDDIVHISLCYRKIDDRAAPLRASDLHREARFCSVDPRLLRGDSIREDQFFLVPNLVPGKRGPEQQTMLIGGRKEALWILVPASSLRITPEQLAARVLAGEIVVRRWTWSRVSGTQSTSQATYMWSSQTVDVRLRTPPKAPPPAVSSPVPSAPRSP